MCGVCGVHERDGRDPPDELTLRSMLGVIRHRGPDDEGHYIADEVALGIRRLSIIDPTGGHQPIRNEDGSVVLVFNGEIYNYRELAEGLRRGGHRLATASDTEVIVHLYEEFGDECLRHLRGMFAFALWDVRRRRLLLARDRLGIKPLYYCQSGGRLVFGSEIKAILRHPECRASPDYEGLSAFLSLKYVPAPRTMFAGVQALPPGHFLTSDATGVRVRAYWDLSFAAARDGQSSEEACLEQLEWLLRESVRLHLVSDVPFGAFLSGGIDSSLIVALMSQILDAPVKTFSVGFEGDGAAYSELPYARMVADRFQTDHHEVFVGARDFVDLAEKIVWHLDQPIADDACLANYMVADLASRHVKMVLTGEGGDELFAGYARYAGERLFPLFRHVPERAKEAALALSRRVPGLERPKLALYALSQSDELERFATWFPLFSPEMKSALLSGSVLEGLNGRLAERSIADQLARTDARDRLSRMLYLDTKLWLPDDLLARGDKTSMAASVEARVPLLDHRLVEFAASLPPELKVRRLTRKYLLRKLAGKWLPTAIVDRKKKGFPVPMSLWLRNEARSFAGDLLSPDAIRRRGLFSPDNVRRLFDQHVTGRADHGSQLWGLISVELWHRLFVDAPPASAAERVCSPPAAVALRRLDRPHQTGSVASPTTHDDA